MGNFEIYCDGSCKGNGKTSSRGGWGFVILHEGEIITKGSGAEENTTNNRMEMIALIEAVKTLLSFAEDSLITCCIYTDSAYVHNCYKDKWYEGWQRNGWRTASRTPVKNKELWEQIIPYFEDWRFSFLKVKGHNGVEYNELVDRLAQEAASKC